MAFINKVTKAIVYATSAVVAKEHFIVEQPMGNEHRMVQNTGSTCELCFFNDNTYSINDSTNKFCLTMAGSQRFGFEWKKRSQDYSKANSEGYIEVDFNLYSK